MFIVEDGSGLPNATSYVSVEWSDEYAENYILNSTEWQSLDDEIKQIHLMSATSYLDTLVKWESSLLSNEQSLAFPRKPFTDKEGRNVQGIPNIIKNATVQFAIEEMRKGSLMQPRKLLTQQAYGNSNETYLRAYEEGSGVLTTYRNTLIKLGYGVSTVSSAMLLRA